MRGPSLQSAHEPVRRIPRARGRHAGRLHARAPCRPDPRHFQRCHRHVHRAVRLQASPRESMDTWFQTKQKGGFPVIGFENAAGELMGFASYGTFRAWPAYKYSVEHSVYVDGRHRGLGLGEALMRALIARARERDVHVLVGGIDAANQGSIRLHEKLGFKHAGTLREAGFKFGRWLDLAFYQLTLDTPANPVDG
ncbi:N-acetyltransferase family protein [Achromobacter xylosoxidans]